MRAFAFKTYILLTIFLGTSVVSFLGIATETENFWLSIHYRTLPFLLLVFILTPKVRFSKQEWLIIGLCFLIYLISLLMNKSAMLAVFVNNAIEPVLLIAILRRYGNRNFVRKTFIIFFLVECSVAWIEVMTRTLIFADTSIMNQNNLTYMLENEMRAYSLHGHPLQNAFLVSILSFFFLTAKDKVFIRYSMFAIGYITLFAFNTRSSIYLMTAIALYVIFNDLKGKKLKKKAKTCIVILVCVAVAVLTFMMIKYDFGNRLVYGLTSSDDSSNTRYMLIGIIFNLPLNDLLWGMDNGIISIVNKYDLYAIENSLANFIVSNGLIFTMLWCILIYLCLKTINPDKKRFNLSFLVFFVLLNANNSLMTEAPIIIFYILSLYSLDSIKPEQKTLPQKLTNRQPLMNVCEDSNAQ